MIAKAARSFPRSLRAPSPRRHAIRFRLLDWLHHPRCTTSWLRSRHRAAAEPAARPSAASRRGYVGQQLELGGLHSPFILRDRDEGASLFSCEPKQEALLSAGERESPQRRRPSRGGEGQCGGAQALALRVGRRRAAARSPVEKAQPCLSSVVERSEKELETKRRARTGPFARSPASSPLARRAALA